MKYHNKVSTFFGNRYRCFSSLKLDVRGRSICTDISLANFPYCGARQRKMHSQHIPESEEFRTTRFVNVYYTISKASLFNVDQTAILCVPVATSLDQRRPLIGRTNARCKSGVSQSFQFLIF